MNASTDPIADMLTRIRNATAVRKQNINLPYSKVKFAVAKILSDNGFINKLDRYIYKFSLDTYE